MGETLTPPGRGLEEYHHLKPIGELKPVESVPHHQDESLRHATEQLLTDGICDNETEAKTLMKQWKRGAKQFDYFWDDVKRKNAEHAADFTGDNLEEIEAIFLGE